MSAAVLGTRGLQVGYLGRAVAQVPDLNLNPRAIWLVTGPNGSGKTTLLKTLAGLLPPVAGEVSPPLGRGRGGVVFVHSTPFLFRGSVSHNLRLATSTAAAIDRAVAAFGLAEYLLTPIAQLSHGLRQRTALARAVLCEPLALLLDEPEGGLDDQALARWRDYAKVTAERAEMTLVVAAHRPAGLEGLPVQSITLGR
jgi:ABC-type multidrug transport system ATPase subunit